MTIFISYSHQPDYERYMEEILKRIKYELSLDDTAINGQAVTQENKRSWIDREEINVGDNLDKTIEKGVDESEYFILFISPPYMLSDYIRKKELPYIVKSATTRGIFNNIIPVFLIETNRSSFIEPEQKALIDNLFCNEAKPLINFNKPVDEYINRFIREVAAKINTGIPRESASHASIRESTMDYGKLIKQIENNRFKINRDKQFIKFKNDPLLRIKRVQKRDTDIIRQSVVFFSGSYNQLVNNFIYRLPLNLGEELATLDFNISKLLGSQNLKSHLKDEARIIDIDSCSDDALDLVLEGLTLTACKLIKDELINPSKKVIIPLYIWFKTDVSYAVALIEKLQTELHKNVCTDFEDRIKEIDIISYFITIIYDNNLEETDFAKKLHDTLNAASLSGYTWHISDFTDLTQSDLESWFDRLKEEEISIDTFQNKFLGLFSTNNAVTMNDFDDFIMDNRYLP